MTAAAPRPALQLLPGQTSRWPDNITDAKTAAIYRQFKKARDSRHRSDAAGRKARTLSPRLWKLHPPDAAAKARIAAIEARIGKRLVPERSVFGRFQWPGDDFMVMLVDLDMAEHWSLKGTRP